MVDFNKRLREFYYRFKPLQDYYGIAFKEQFKFLLESQLWSREKLQDYKLKRLCKLVRYAEKNVPYYRELFKEHDIKSSDIKSFDDYRKIPVLTKEIVQANSDRLKSDNFSNYQTIIAKTSGTTGNVTTIYRTLELETIRKACLWRFFFNHDLNFDDLRMTVFNPGRYHKDAPFFEYDKLENKVNIFTYHIFARNLDPILDLIRRFKPVMIWAHPNVLSVLAEYIIDSKQEPLKIPLIATYGELIDPRIKKVLTQGLPSKYIEYYGNRENTVAAWGNSDGMFHEISEYCHLEVENNNQEGDIVSTSLHNYAFPMLRYKPGDYIKWIGDCDNQPYPKFELIGARGKNLLLSRNGLICPMAMYYLEKNGFKKMRMFQLEQVSIDKVIARMVPRDNYDRNIDEPEFIKLVEDALLNNFKISVDYVEDIPFSKQGKYKPVISKLAVEYLQKVTGEIK